MKAVKKAVCITGEYQQNGQTKKRYATVGRLLQRDDGSIVLKMDVCPVNFDGWVSFYDLDEEKKESSDVPF